MQRKLQRKVANALSNAVAGLAATLKSVAGESGVYPRGPTKSSPITAVSDVQTYEVLDQQGVPINVVSHDFLFTAADLVVGSGTIALQRRGPRLSTLAQ